METLSHNGSAYIKANVLAKRHHYTSDYLGQLCRQGKVDAQLVGRAWYINEASLFGHKADHKKDVRPNEILSKNAVEIMYSDKVSPAKIEVHPSVSKKTHRQFFANELHSSINHNWQNRAVSYTDDPATLVPQVTNKIIKTLVESVPASAAVALPVALVDSEKVSVKDVSNYNHREHLAFTELPEVSLRGQVSIVDLEDGAELDEAEPVTMADLHEHEELEVKPRAVIVGRYQKSVRQERPVLSRSNRVENSRIEAGIQIDPVTTNVLAQRTAARSRIRAVPIISNKRHAPLLVPLLVLVSVAVTSLLMSISSVTHLEGTSVQESFSFNKSMFGEALLYLAHP